MTFPALTLLRLTAPFTILRCPLPGLLLCTLIDVYDWKFAPLHDPAAYAFYQKWDKAMDLYYWLFAVHVVITQWGDKTVKRVALGLFGYRLIGWALFELTGWRPFLLIFPNFFENFFIFYLLYQYFCKGQKLFKSHLVTLIVMSALIIPKIIHEYFMHFLLKQPWEIFDVAGRLGLTGIVHEYANYFIWGGLFYVLPLSGVLIILCYLNSRKKDSHLTQSLLK